MEFTTTDSKLTIEGTTISQKRLTNEYRRNLILYAFFFAFGVNMLIEKIEIAQLAGKTSKWILVGLLSVFMLLYIGILLEFLFKQHWKNKIDISKIAEIKTYQSKEELETNVVVKLKSKRYKVYKFRTLEKQVENFIATLQSINPTTQLVKG